MKSYIDTRVFVHVQKIIFFFFFFFFFCLKQTAHKLDHTYIVSRNNRTKEIFFELLNNILVCLVWPFFFLLFSLAMMTRGVGILVRFPRGELCIWHFSANKSNKSTVFIQ